MVAPTGVATGLKENGFEGKLSLESELFFDGGLTFFSYGKDRATDGKTIFCGDDFSVSIIQNANFV